MLNEFPKIKNGIEGWHTGFSSKLKCSYASLWKFLHAIQLEKSFTENKMSVLIAKKVFPKYDRKYIDINK